MLRSMLGCNPKSKTNGRGRYGRCGLHGRQDGETEEKYGSNLAKGIGSPQVNYDRLDLIEYTPRRGQQSCVLIPVYGRIYLHSD